MPELGGSELRPTAEEIEAVGPPRHRDRQCVTESCLSDQFFGPGRTIPLLVPQLAFVKLSAVERLYGEEHRGDLAPRKPQLAPAPAGQTRVPTILPSPTPFRPTRCAIGGC